ISTQSTETSTTPMILGSWDIRGLVHAARLLPEYTGSNHEEKKYTMGDVPDCDRSQRLREKSKLGLDFPNLPYSIDDLLPVELPGVTARHQRPGHRLSDTCLKDNDAK
uniref:GST N-terminal domain-containing protein n=1 Tax=Balaenoptera musculus TaxID=9771 RepID=A0A8C0D5W2_BALMU